MFVLARILYIWNFIFVFWQRIFTFLFLYTLPVVWKHSCVLLHYSTKIQIQSSTHLLVLVANAIKLQPQNPFRLGPVAVKKWTIPHLCVCTTVCGCPKINPPGILPRDQFYRNQLTEWAAGCLSAASKYHYYYDKCAHICYPGRERKRGCTSMWRQPGER
jgi:hypothetical protein